MSRLLRFDLGGEVYFFYTLAQAILVVIPINQWVTKHEGEYFVYTPGVVLGNGFGPEQVADGSAPHHLARSIRMLRVETACPGPEPGRWLWN